jgi:hypothetical protein
MEGGFKQILEEGATDFRQSDALEDPFDDETTLSLIIRFQTRRGVGGHLS